MENGRESDKSPLETGTRSFIVRVTGSDHRINEDEVSQLYDFVRAFGVDSIGLQKEDFIGFSYVDKASNAYVDLELKRAVPFRKAVELSRGIISVVDAGYKSTVI